MLADYLEHLRDPNTFDCGGPKVDLIETHISWVFLCGDRVYKFKKPVDFGFLNFSTLEKRRFYCHEELRLNQRYSPQIYLSVGELRIVNGRLTFGSDGEIVDYAVIMRRFNESQRLDRVLARGELSTTLIDEIAVKIAHFHQDLAAPNIEPDTDKFLASVWHPIEENFQQIRAVFEHMGAGFGAAVKEKLLTIEQHSNALYSSNRDRLLNRNRDGFIRECHGDLHLQNIALFDGVPILFDCIEFNSEFRCIDVISDIAFLVMDLDFRGQERAAIQLLNRYLEITGDYDGVGLLPMFCSYRAMVRAKVDALRFSQLEAAQQQQKISEFNSYLDLCARYHQSRRGRIYLTCGFSGSGKSFIGRALAYQRKWIILRSDIERKRLVGLAASARTSSSLGAGLYAEEMTRETYQKLALLAVTIARSGYDVLVDATFLARWQRDLMLSAAHENGSKCYILHFNTPVAICRQRIATRLNEAVDPSEATVEVLQRQLTSFEGFTDEEKKILVEINNNTSLDFATLSNDIP